MEESFAVAETLSANETGVFEIAGLTADLGHADLEFRCPGYATELITGFLLNSGSTTELGDVILHRPGTIQGLVVDDYGSPVGNATIVWEQAQFDAPRTAGIAIGRSNEAGTFEIRGVTPGLGCLAAVAPSHVAEWSQPIRIAPAATTSQIVLRAIRGVEVRGRVVNRDSGEPVRAHLRFRSLERDRIVATESNENGDYRIAGIRRGGSYSVHARIDGRLAGIDGGNHFDITPALETQLDLRVVARDWLPLRILDATTNQPISGAQIGPMPFSPYSSPAMPLPKDRLWSKSGADGVCSLDGLSTLHTLVIQAEGYLPEKVEWRHKGPDSTERLVRLAPSTSVRLRVTENGQPVTDATIDVLVREHSPRQAGLQNQHFRSIARQTTGASGHAGFEQLVDNTYFVRVTVDGVVRLFSKIGLYKSRDDRHIELSAPSSLVGRVGGCSNQIVIATTHDSYTFSTRPRSDGSYSMDVPSGVSLQVLAVTIPPGRWPERVGRLSRATSSTKRLIDIHPGANYLDLPGARCAGSVRGRVRIHGRPAAFRPIQLNIGASQPAYEPRIADPFDWITSTDHAGRFEFEHVPPGAWRIDVKGCSNIARWISMAFADVLLEPNRTAEIEIDLETASATFELVERGTGKIRFLPRFQLVHREWGQLPELDAVNSWRYTDHMTVPELPAGSYELRRDGRTHATFTLEPGEHHELRFEIEPDTK